MADIFDVVADPTRRDLLQILLQRHTEGIAEGRDGESSVGELVTRLGLSQPTVSKHLKVLREAALVTVRDQGQHRYYRLSLAPLHAVEEWLAPFLAVERSPAAAAVEPAPPVLVLPERLRRAAHVLGEAGAWALNGVRTSGARTAGRLSLLRRLR